MSQRNLQKLKILYLAQYLQENSDFQHPITIASMINHLKSYDISAERKSLYTDIEALCIFGMDIRYRRDKPTGYYLESREFALAELKLLVDAVSSSKFITLKKTRELIHKLEKLAGIHEAKQLQRQVFVANRVKSMNEGAYSLVDQIHTAISANEAIAFKYSLWLPTKKMALRKEGQIYRVSPYALVWDNENYYLIGYDHESQTIKHYRVDKMLEIRNTKMKREGQSEFKKFDVDEYVKQTFGMYGGEEATIKLQCDNELAGVIIDRFGSDILMHPINQSQFTAIFHVKVSAPFLGWLAGLGTGAKLISPEAVVEQFENHLTSILELYK